MSRSGYIEDFDEQWWLICWRGAVASAIRGRRGQAFLREMLSALDALPHKRLIAGQLEHDGDFCALGTVGHRRGTPMTDIDSEDHERIAGRFGIAHALACETMWVNDEAAIWPETPEQRFERVRAWVVKSLKTES